MMPFDAQSLITGAAVLVAVGYLGWRSVRIIRSKKSAGCGSSCGDCPSSAANAPLVQISAEKDRR
jgi:hypothetical protein